MREPPGSDCPTGQTALRMVRAVAPHRGFVTPMAAVAGAVADTVLAAVVAEARITRAYVNNGGDIALHLGPETAFRTAMAGADGQDLGRLAVRHGQGIGGIATSGRHGRSLSMGIADSVTVLATTAAQADVAATLIANAVDLPGHPSIHRIPACDVVDDSDLGTRPVVTGCGPLTNAETRNALAAGKRCADEMQAKGLIHAAALFLNGGSLTTAAQDLLTTRTPENA